MLTLSFSYIELEKTDHCRHQRAQKSFKSMTELFHEKDKISTHAFVCQKKFKTSREGKIFQLPNPIGKQRINESLNGEAF